MSLRQLAGVVGVLLMALVGVITGWSHLWALMRQASGLMFGGWLLGMLGVLLLATAPRRGRAFRVGLILSALGLATLWVPQDGQGVMTGLRVGFGGALLALMPRVMGVWRQRPLASKNVSGRKTAQEPGRIFDVMGS